MTRREWAENEIFRLRERAGAALAAGDTAEFQRLQIAIVLLQETYGIFSGVKRRDDARTAS